MPVATVGAKSTARPSISTRALGSSVDTRIEPVSAASSAVAETTALAATVTVRGAPRKPARR
jgi:hypothetical protein